MTKQRATSQIQNELEVADPGAAYVHMTVCFALTSYSSTNFLRQLTSGILFADQHFRRFFICIHNGEGGSNNLVRKVLRSSRNTSNSSSTSKNRKDRKVTI